MPHRKPACQENTAIDALRNEIVKATVARSLQRGELEFRSNNQKKGLPLKPRKQASPSPRFEEIELKLALPSADPSSLAQQLASVPALKRHKASHEHLHSVYYDTPEQRLRQQRTALRIRRIGSASSVNPVWIQTLKTGGRDDSALSQRGEWESPVPDASLSFGALKETPWPAIDPDGTLFLSLAPCFVTRFERTAWQVRQRDGSVVEVALDIGQIEAGGKVTPLCELELELKSGPTAGLFHLAHKIARSMAVLPSTMSKAERGFALAQDTLHRPRHTQPQTLDPKQPLPLTAQRVLREMFNQFTANLNALRASDDPELVHQARIGWRRFQSARRLFGPVLVRESIPDWEPLQALLRSLGTLRDLDVARTVTLPPLATVYSAGETARTSTWDAMMQTLNDASTQQRQGVREALLSPLVGACLLDTTQWLEEPFALKDAAHKPPKKISLRKWADHRISRLNDKLQKALAETSHPDEPHRVRLLAKRLRYGIEVLRAQLPPRHAQQWHQQASQLQLRLGATRDITQASLLLTQLPVDASLAEFLRGFSLRQRR